MENSKIGFLTNSMTLSKINESMLIHVFVDSYSIHENFFLACGNIDICQYNIPFYGIGTILVKIKSPELLEKTAFIKYYHSGGESLLVIDLNIHQGVTEYTFNETNRELVINSVLLDVNSVQILGDNKRLKQSKKEGNLVYFYIPQDVTEVSIRGRFYHKSIKVSKIIEHKSIEKTYTYSLSYEFDKAILNIDVTNCNENSLLIEGDFKGYRELGEGKGRIITLSNATYFKHYKEFVFSVNGIVEKSFLIKPGSYPTNATWIVSQRKIKFNKELSVPSTLVINGVNVYEINSPIVEFKVENDIIPYSLVLTENMKGNILLEKFFDAPVVAGEKNTLPLLVVDTVNKKLKLDSVSKQVVQVNIQGMPAIFFKPGEVVVELPYQFYKKKGVVKFTIDSIINCNIKNSTFYIIV